MAKFMAPFVLGLALCGCASTGKMLKGEYPESEFPSGYKCTNYSLPYMQVTYGIIKGYVSIEPDDPFVYLFGPSKEDCNPNDEKLIDFARRFDKNSDRVLTYSEVSNGMKKLKKNDLK